MSVGRLCVLLVVLVSVKMMAAQPTFGTQWWCDMFCSDDDDDDYADPTAFIEALLGCDACETDEPPKRTPTVSPGMQQPFNIMIPPSNGLNLTMTSTGSSWLMNLMPWAAKPAAATTVATPTTAAATTKAGGGGTTKAGGTTAAPTTTAKP